MASQRGLILSMIAIKRKKKNVAREEPFSMEKSS